MPFIFGILISVRTSPTGYASNNVSASVPSPASRILATGSFRYAKAFIRILRTGIESSTINRSFCLAFAFGVNFWLLLSLRLRRQLLAFHGKFTSSFDLPCLQSRQGACVLYRLKNSRTPPGAPNQSSLESSLIYHLTSGSAKFTIHPLRSINRGEQVCGERISEKVVWHYGKYFSYMRRQQEFPE